MAGENGTVSFTKERPTFELEGVTFRTRAIDPSEWAETLEAAARGEREVSDSGGVVIGISAEGTEQLILLAIAEEDHDAWRKLRGEKAIDFGQLNALREWVWEQMTERPFFSDSESGPGPGTIEASSKDESPSPEEIEVH